MLNQVVIVGKLVDDPEIIKLDNGNILSRVILAVQRSYENDEGEYDYDYIDCYSKSNLALGSFDCCKKDDIIGIKGKIETREYEKNNQKCKDVEIVAEKITFLNKRTNENEENLER